MISGPTDPRGSSTVRGPLPASTGTGGTEGASREAPVSGTETPPPARIDGAAASADLRETEGRREGATSTSARDAHRARVDRLRERIRGLSSLPDAQARTALTEILGEARSLETSGDTNHIVDDLIAIRGCYRELSRSTAGSYWRDHPDHGTIATSLTRVEATMRATRDIFRGAVRGESGTYSARDRLHMSRLAIRLSRDLSETSTSNEAIAREGGELLTDYRNELNLLRSLGSSDLTDRDRTDRIGRNLTELFELRRSLRGATTHEWIEGRDVELVTHDAEERIAEVNTLMRDYAIDLHNASSGFIESRGASAAIDRLMSGIIEGEREALVPRLSAEGLTEYCRQSAEAEAAVERAGGLSDPAERRTALAEALRGFVALGDSTRVNDVFDQMVASLPADAGDLLRLQVFTAMGSILHGSGMGAEERLRDLASPIARRLASTPTPSMYREEIEVDDFSVGGTTRAHTVSRTLVNPRAYLDTAASILAVRSYFTAVGDSEAARATDERLGTLRSQLDDQLGGTTDSRRRIEIAATSVEIDMALDGIASPEHLSAWRNSIRSATDLPTDDRLTQARTLLRVATLCRREAESSGTTRTDLAEINTWATQVIGDIAADRIRHLRNERHVDAEFADAVIADFRSRLDRAVTDGDTAWLGAVSERAIDQFADLAQSGHVLLSGRHTPPTRRELQACLQAAAIFGRLGLNARVNEAMAPLITQAEGIENSTERANFYLTLGQVFQEAGMSTEANGMLDRIVALDVEGAPRELHRIAEMVPAMREMNLGHLDRARELLGAIRGNPRAEEMLRNVEGAVRRARALQVLDALRLVAGDYIAQERERGSTRASESDREIRRALDEAQRLILSGRCGSVREALRRFSDYGLRDMLWESRASAPIRDILDASADITLSDDTFSDRMLSFASSLSAGRMYSSASQIGNLLTRNPHTRDAARALVDGIPGEARLSGILTELGNMTIIFAESDAAAIRSGVITAVTFGVGSLAARGAELAFAAYVTETTLASTVALRATGFVAGSLTEAVTYNLADMAFETMFSGRTDHWTLENFGRRVGAMLVTFMFCRSMGAITSGLGRAAARTSLLGEAAAGGGRTLTLGGRIAVGTLGYGGTITGLTGVEYLNEAMGLHPSEGHVPFLTRLLGAAVMDAQMRLAGRLANEVTGGTIERWGAATRERYAIHELLPAVERLGFGRPNERGELSAEGMTALSAMLARVARGESAADVASSVGRETSGDLSRVTSMVLGVDANSAEGRRLQALLFSYRASHPEADLAEVAGRLQVEAGRLARAAGLREGPAYEIVRAELLRRALASGATVESLSSGGEAMERLRPELEGLANELLGPRGAASLEGQRLIGDLLLRTLDHPGGVSVEGGVVARIREQVRGMGLDPASAAGRRMAADLLLARLAPASETLALEANAEAGSSRLDGGVLHVDFSRPGFRHVSIAGHGEIWFGETAAAGEYRVDNHTGETITVIRAHAVPEGSGRSMTETLAPETASAPAGSTVLRPGDRIRFADGREFVVGEPLRAARAEAPAEGPGAEGTARPGRTRTGEAPVIPLEGRGERPPTAEPDLLAAFRHADPSEPPSRELLRRSFALSDRLARELGLTDPHDAAANRPFREAFARRAARGPVTESTLREIRDSFRALDASLHGVDPMMRSEVRRRAFTRLLSGEMSGEAARELSRRIREGEVRVETGRDGALDIVEVPAEGRAEARSTARRRIFDHLAEAHFPETVTARLRSGYESGSVTLERLEATVESLPAVRRWISAGGVEPSSTAGHRILSRTVVGLAEGRLELREGRVVEAARGEGPRVRAPETGGTAEGAPPLPAEVEGLITRNFPERLRERLRAGVRDGSITQARLEAAVGALPAVRRFIADSGTDPSSREGARILDRVVTDLATGRLEVREGRIVRPGVETEARPEGGDEGRGTVVEGRGRGARDRAESGEEAGTVVEGRGRGGRTEGSAEGEGPMVSGAGSEGVSFSEGTLTVDFSDARRPFRNATIPGLRGPIRLALATGGGVMLLNTSGEPVTVVRPNAREGFLPEEVVRPETATAHPGRAELVSGDRIRLADGREIVLRFEIPAEGAEAPAEPAGPPGGPVEPESGAGGGTVVLGPRRPPTPDPAAEVGTVVIRGGRPAEPAPREGILPMANPEGTPVEAIPRAPRVLADGERAAAIDVRLTEIAFPDPAERGGFANNTVALELGSIADGLEGAHPEVARSIRGDLRTLETEASVDSPAFEAAARRLAAVVRTRRFDAAFRGADVPLMSGEMRRDFARRVAELYDPAAGPGRVAELLPPPPVAPPEPGVTERRDMIQRGLLDLAFSGRARPAFAERLRAVDQLELLATRLEEDGFAEAASDLRTDLTVLREGSVHGPAFQNTMRRLGRVLGTHVGEATSVPLVNAIGEADFARLAQSIEAIYRPPAVEAPAVAEGAPLEGDPFDFGDLNAELGLEGGSSPRRPATGTADPLDWGDMNAELGLEAPGTARPPESGGAPEAPPPEAPVAPVVPLRPPVPAVREAPRLAALAADVAVMGDTVLIGEEVFSLRTERADAVMGEVPPVERTVFRFTNTTLTGGSGVALALPSTYTAEDAARMVSRLSPSVRRSLSRMRPEDVGRIVEMSERMRASSPATTVEGYALPASMGGGTVGGGIGESVVCTGEIIGVGSGRTTFRGYVTEADGTRRPVALVMLTHSMGGTFHSEALNLSRLAEAGVGEVRFDGLVRIDGRQALVVNLAEGTPHVGLGDLSVRDRADFNPLMARDLARMAVAGYTSGAGTDFQYIWGRDARGRPRLQWIDTESSVLTIDDARTAALRERLGRETLTAQDWYLENLRGFGLYNPETGRFADGVPHTFQDALRYEPSASRPRGERSSTLPPPPS